MDKTSPSKLRFLLQIHSYIMHHFLYLLALERVGGVQWLVNALYFIPTYPKNIRGETGKCRDALPGTSQGALDDKGSRTRKGTARTRDYEVGGPPDKTGTKTRLFPALPPCLPPRGSGPCTRLHFPSISFLPSFHNHQISLFFFLFS